MVQTFDEGNIDEIKFFSIHQNFPYQTFLLAAIANVVLATVLVNFSQCQFVNISLIKTLC